MEEGATHPPGKATAHRRVICFRRGVSGTLEPECWDGRLHEWASRARQDPGKVDRTADLDTDGGEAEAVFSEMASYSQPDTSLSWLTSQSDVSQGHGISTGSTVSLVMLFARSGLERHCGIAFVERWSRLAVCSCPRVQRNAFLDSCDAKEGQVWPRAERR